MQAIAVICHWVPDCSHLCVLQLRRGELVPGLQALQAMTRTTKHLEKPAAPDKPWDLSAPLRPLGNPVLVERERERERDWPGDSLTGNPQSCRF